MERHLAIRMLAALQSLETGFDEATKVTQEMGDEEEARQMRRYLGTVMTGPLFDIVMHIIRQHPDLDPDRPPSTGEESGG